MYGDSVLECPVRHAKICNIFQSGDHTKTNEVMFCCHKSTMGREYIAMVSWSDLFFFCEIHDKIAICRTVRREILHPMHFFCIFYYKTAFSSRQSVDIIALL